MELLIAFTLISLISLLLFSGLRLATRAWEAVDNTAERTGELRVARNFLERALSQSKAVTLTLDAEQYLVFTGDAETLEFVAPLSEHVGIPGLYILRLSLTGRGDAQLVMTRWLLHPDVLQGTAEIPEWEPFDGAGGLSNVAADADEDIAAGAYGTTLLVESVDEFEMSYFGVQEGEGVGEETVEGDWYEDWFEQPRPPMAVRLRLTTTEQGWPDMLVRLPDSER